LRAVAVNHGFVLGLLALFIVFILLIIVSYRLCWTTATISVESHGIWWGREAMNYNDFDSTGRRTITRKANRGLLGTTDSYVYIEAKGREIAVTKEINGEGAREIAAALERATVIKLTQLSPIVR
jgi:hypothetical protein